MVSFRHPALICLLLVCITSNNSFTNALEIDNVNVIVTESSKTTEHIQYLSLDLDKTDSLNIEVTADAAFFVIQVHSFKIPITLSTDLHLQRNSSVKGNAIGLIQKNIKNNSNYTFYLENDIDDEVILIAVTTYGMFDPIPGGCNLTFDVEDAPYQVLSYSDELIMVDAQASSEMSRYCENTKVTLEMYHMRLTRWDFSPETYFQGIRKMITVEQIRKNGVKESESPYKTNLRRFYANYVGTVTIYAIIATYNGHSSAYVPIGSPGCDITNDIESCPVFGDDEHYAIALLLILFGFQIIVFGRKLKMPQCERRDLLIYLCVIFIVIPLLLLEIEIYYLLGSSFLVLGLFIVSNVLIVSSEVISRIYISYIATCATFYFTPSFEMGDIFIFQDNWCYCLVFATMVLIFFAVSAECNCWNLLLEMQLAVGINYLFGGSLLYMYLNNLRRLTVTNFNYAILDPPVTADESLHILGVLIFSRAILILWNNTNDLYTMTSRWYSSRRNRPSVKKESTKDELTPLLA